MTREEKIKELEETIKKAKEEIDQLKNRTEANYVPYEDETFYMIDCDGEVILESWFYGDYCTGLLAIGNVFETKEQAEFAVEKLKVETELRRFACPFDEDEFNFSIVWDVDERKIIADAERHYMSTNIYFKAESIAQQAIDTVGEDRIKKYYFGVD